MTEFENSVLASNAEPRSSDSAPDRPYDQVAAVDDERGGDGAELGGHTLLSRAPAPQGRRSLFRR